MFAGVVLTVRTTLLLHALSIYSDGFLPNTCVFFLLVCGIAAQFSEDHSPTAGTETDVVDEPSTADSSLLSRRGPDRGHSVSRIIRTSDRALKIKFWGTVLHLRGETIQEQPVFDEAGNIFCWNGEVFGGSPTVPLDRSDTRCVFDSLVSCAADGNGAERLVDVMSNVQGPWSFLFWDSCTSRLWWGRDNQGRRSLLVSSDPGPGHKRLTVSSVPFLGGAGAGAGQTWAEVPTTGLFCAHWSPDEGGIVRVTEHPWRQSQRTYSLMKNRLMISPEDGAAKQTIGSGDGSMEDCVDSFLRHLDMATAARLPHSPKDKSVAVLFSGGLDCTVVAALLHRNLPAAYEIELLNACFDPKHKSPDRLTALGSYRDLLKVFPTRAWRFVQVDVPVEEVIQWQDHVLQLLCPMETQMDFKIGAALWFASRGEGMAFESGAACTCDPNRAPQRYPCNFDDCSFVAHCQAYRSQARIVFTGIGADEQLGGYARHHSAFHKYGGWERLNEELVKDTERLWVRNHGRDDRCISDHGKEPRYPFLDENVVKKLASFPLWVLTDPRMERGFGDKLILRNVARKLKLEHCVSLPKRAIQFGSRIAKQSARRTRRGGAGTRHVKGTDRFETSTAGQEK